MMQKDEHENGSYEARRIESTSLGKPRQSTKTGDKELDLVNLLQGTWISRAEGWNLIALPASPADLKEKPAHDKENFRLLMNQYGETLKFNVPDTGVPNRGIPPDENKNPDQIKNNDPDQIIDAITYEQVVVQRSFADSPESIKGRHAENGEPIHHEPGFFLQFRNQVSTGTSPDFKDASGNKVEKILKIARMGTIPHGNSVLAMGFVSHDKKIKDDNAFPERLKTDKEGEIDMSDAFNKSYLEPYTHFVKHPFKGCVDPKSDFSGFSPDKVHKILQDTQAKLNVRNTTVLNFDTKFKVAGIDDDVVFDPNERPIAGFPISNVPFVKRKANVTEMHATFWIMELERADNCEPPEFVMQYSQTVYLEFFDSPVVDADGKRRRIRWPHISINTLRKVDP